MLKQIQILKWLLEVDREATIEAYDGYAQSDAFSCTCLYCRNFREALDRLPNEFLELCLTIGVDPNKPSEVWELTQTSEHPASHLYAGFYHIVGKILTMPDNIIEKGWTVIQTAQLTDGFDVHFRNQDSLVPAAFPRPVFALEFSAIIPWLLDEQP
jgi:hypothetical protein